MSRNRKDACGGHRKTYIDADSGAAGLGITVWGESGKRYAKRLRSKLARRHARVSLRDLEIIEPEETCETLDYEDAMYEGDYGDYDDDYSDYDRDDDRDYGSHYAFCAETQYVIYARITIDAGWVQCSSSDIGAVWFVEEEL